MLFVIIKEIEELRTCQGNIVKRRESTNDLKSWEILKRDSPCLIGEKQVKRIP